MKFQIASIDRSIVMTSYDLRGFAHPCGFRAKPMKYDKGIDAIAHNLLAFAAKGAKLARGEQFPDYFACSYGEYLSACKDLAASCDDSQQEAIQHILREMIRQNAIMRAEIAGGRRENTKYIQPLSKRNYWGRAVLAMAEAFGLSRWKLRQVAKKAA